MKSKFFKIVLPAFAFMLAIAFSFATQTQNDMGYLAVDGYIQDPGQTDCTPDRIDCLPIGDIMCTSTTVFGNPQVFKKTNSECNTLLFLP